MLIKSKSGGGDANTRRAREEEKTREEKMKEKKEAAKSGEKKRKGKRLVARSTEPRLGQNVCKTFIDREIVCHIPKPTIHIATIYDF